MAVLGSKYMVSYNERKSKTLFEIHFSSCQNNNLRLWSYIIFTVLAINITNDNYITNFHTVRCHQN